MIDGTRREGANDWAAIATVLGAAAIIFSIIVGVIFVKDPYGRSGFRPSAQVPELGERELKVSRAMDQNFDSAIVGNSTSIPMQPEILDELTGLRFVSLSISGSGAPVALTMTRFFLSRHQAAKAIIVGLDDTWCRNAIDMAEGRPFPFWLYGNDVSYIFGLYENASYEMLDTAVLMPRGGNRLDGYKPLGEAFHRQFDDINFVKQRLDRVQRPTKTRYRLPFRFEPPALVERLIDEFPSVTFVLFWTPRYVNLIPKPETPAAEVDAACKQQTADIRNGRQNVTIVDWSGQRPENMDPSNFYEANHYRDKLAVKIEREIGVALKGF